MRTLIATLALVLTALLPGCKTSDVTGEQVVDIQKVHASVEFVSKELAAEAAALGGQHDAYDDLTAFAVYLQDVADQIEVMDPDAPKVDQILDMIRTAITQADTLADQYDASGDADVASWIRRASATLAAARLALILSE